MIPRYKPEISLKILEIPEQYYQIGDKKKIILRLFLDFESWGRFPIAQTKNYVYYFVYFSDLKTIYSYFITIIVMINIIHWKSNEYNCTIQNWNHVNSVLLSVSRHQVLKGVLIWKINNRYKLVSCKNPSSVPFNLQLWSKITL